MDVDAATAVANENIGILKQVAEMIEDLSDEIYADNNVPPYHSGVGKHIRHVLDFYRAFADIDNGRIDYDLRERSPAIETSRKQAIEAIEQIVLRLESIHDADRRVMCKNDDGGHRRSEHTYSMSTIGRELQFLASHSVHHFAIISMILVQRGLTPPRDFGVAASTLIHWQNTGDVKHA